MEISPTSKITFNTSQGLLLVIFTCFAGTKRLVQHFSNSTSKGILFSGYVGMGCLALSETLPFEREPYFILSLRRTVAFVIGSSIFAPLLSKMHSKELTLSLKDGCKFGLYGSSLNALFFIIYPRSTEPTYAEANLLRRGTDEVPSNASPIENLEETKQLSPIIIKSNLTGIYPIVLSLFSLIEESIETKGIYRIPCSTKDLNKKYGAIKSEKLKDPRADLKIKTFPHLACCLVKQIIREIPESEKIPSDLFSDFSCKTTEEKELVAYNVLNNLNLDYRSFLKVIFDHFRKIADKAHLNKMDIKNLSVVFSPNLFQSVSELNNPFEQQILNQMSLECLIKNNFEFFYV